MTSKKVWNEVYSGANTSRQIIYTNKYLISPTISYHQFASGCWAILPIHFSIIQNLQTQNELNLPTWLILSLHNLHMASSNTYHSNHQRAQTSRGNGSGSRHTSGRSSRRDSPPQPVYAYYYVWTCHACVGSSDIPQSSGMTTYIESCPECDHFRCEDCELEIVWYRVGA